MIVPNPTFTHALPHSPASSQSHSSEALTQPGALLVSPDPADYSFMASMFDQQQWSLQLSRDLSDAFDLLTKSAFSLVVTERDLPDGRWTQLLERRTAVDQRLVVISRHADERLWAEVLDLGGYDLLAKPLCEFEVLTVLRQALGVAHTTVAERH